MYKIAASKLVPFGPLGFSDEALRINNLVTSWCPNHNNKGSESVTQQNDQFHNRINKKIYCYCVADRKAGDFTDLRTIQKKHLSSLRDFTKQFQNSNFPYGSCH